jgi:hypothetical protein
LSALEVLNPRAEAAELDPLELSERLVVRAVEVSRSGGCEALEPLVAQLRGVDPTGLAGQGARLAFWLNTYNALLLHCLCRRPLRGSLLRHLRMFDRVAYDVGGHPYTLNLIEHGVLRGNQRPPLRLRRPVRAGDPRLDAVVPELDPRVHFALNCGARSCPPVRPYAPDRVDAELEAATGAYLATETDLDASRRRVALPRLIRMYRDDFGTRGERLAFAARYLPELRRLLDDEGGRVRVRYRRFDWTLATPAPA